VFMSTSDRMAQLYPQALSSLSVAFYDSHGYRGGILTHLHTGICWYHRQHLCYELCQVHSRWGHWIFQLI
jgi:hypothetical protein